MSKKARTPFQPFQPLETLREWITESAAEQERTLCALTTMQQQLGAVRGELATLWQELARLKRAASTTDPNTHTHNNHHASDSPNTPHGLTAPLRGE